MTTQEQDEIILEQIRQKQELENRRISPMSSPVKSFRSVIERIDRINAEKLEERGREYERQQAELTAEAERRRISDAWNGSEVGDRFIPCRLENYDTPTSEHRTALAACIKSVKSLKDGEGVLLLGEPKSGKTHLLCGMLYEAAKEGLSIRYITAEDFYVKLRSRIDEGLSEDGFLNFLARPNVLALDDMHCVAAAKSSHEESYQYRMLWLLLDRRYRNARATIAGTNKPLKDFKEMLDERTTRRLEAKIVNVPKRIGK